MGKGEPNGMGVTSGPFKSQIFLQANVPQVAASEDLMGSCQKEEQDTGGPDFQSDRKPSAELVILSC